MIVSLSSILFTPEFDTSDLVDKIKRNFEADDSCAILILGNTHFYHFGRAQLFAVPADAGYNTALCRQGKVFPGNQDFAESRAKALIHNKYGQAGAAGNADAAAVAAAVLYAGNGVDVFADSDSFIWASALTGVAGNLLVTFDYHIGTGFASINIGKLGLPIALLRYA
jgi:hypothetical protein